jgi:hypothetical protein
LFLQVFGELLNAVGARALLGDLLGALDHDSKDSGGGGGDAEKEAVLKVAMQALLVRPLHEVDLSQLVVQAVKVLTDAEKDHFAAKAAKEKANATTAPTAAAAATATSGPASSDEALMSELMDDRVCYAAMELLAILNHIAGGDIDVLTLVEGLTEAEDDDDDDDDDDSRVGGGAGGGGGGGQSWSRASRNDLNYPLRRCPESNRRREW